MKSNRSRLLEWPVVVAAGFLLVVAGLSYCGVAPADDWKAPPRAKNKQNPVPADAATIAAGKTIYVGTCMACHGAAGKGDGPAAVTCNPRPKNLSDPQIASQADGELFWKITEGKKPMPTYEKLLSESDRWKVIDYIRTLAPRPPGSK